MELPETQPGKPDLAAAEFQILLALAGGDLHGYRIMQAVDEDSGGRYHMGPGTLYTSLKRLLEKGLVEETGERPDPALDDQRRRYYRITAAGRRAAAAEAARLETLVAQAHARRLLPSSAGDQ